MTDILDIRLQTEIHRTTQDTNRGVLQLHKDLISLQRLVKALDIKMQARTYPEPILPAYTPVDDASGLRLLAQLAKFKAFNESMDSPETSPWDEATSMTLELGNVDKEKASMRIDSSKIHLLSQIKAASAPPIRCEADYVHKGRKQRVWIEWKEYDSQRPGTPSQNSVIVERVQKLAALLHHSPKPEAFRVPHCLGYFDNAKRPNEPDVDSEGEEESGDPRIGFVFEKPEDKDVSPETPPISLFELLSRPKPRVTDRIRLAHAIANCLLYLHSVNWLHKGLRSHNIVFFPSGKEQKIDYSKPYLSGFDFARPARADEMTEVPGDVPEYNMYRHPSTQGTGFGPRESFRKSFDIYSFGVVLVELAHWETIEKVLQVEKTKVRMINKIRDLLLEEKSVMELGASMGEIYENAARKCIAGGLEFGVGEHDDETDDVVASKLSMKFYEDVVKKLGDVKV